MILGIDYNGPWGKHIIETFIGSSILTRMRATDKWPSTSALSSSRVSRVRLALPQGGHGEGVGEGRACRSRSTTSQKRACGGDAEGGG